MVRGLPNPRHLGLPARLRKARKLAGLTRMALAEKATVGTPTVLYIETTQRMPSVGTIARLASALSVTASWLSFGLGLMHTDDPPEKCDGMGERLQAVRIEKGQTKASLGRLAHLAAPSIAQIENGGQAGVDTIERLAKALGISPAWLAYGVGSRELPPRRRSRLASLATTTALPGAGQATAASLDRRRDASA